MDIERLKPNVIAYRAIFPEPVQVIAVIPNEHLIVGRLIPQPCFLYWEVEE
jgi:hypothetical protein